MRFVTNHPRIAIALGVALVLLIFVGGYGMWLASEANRLPWQADPTRIAVEPFSGIPGFGNAVATPTGP